MNASSTLSLPAGAGADDREVLRRELARRLAKQEMASSLFAFLGYGPQAYMAKGAVPDAMLLIWLVTLVVAEMFSATTCYFLKRSLDNPVRRQRLTSLLMVCVGISGSIWGSVILMPGLHDNPTTGALQATAIGIVAIASTQAMATHPGCLAMYTLGILWPTVVSGFADGGLPVAFGVAAIGLYLMCQVYGLTTRKLVVEAIQAEQAIRKGKEAAEAANRAKSVFLSNMSHELRTPLNAILGYAQLLSRQDGLTAQQRRQINVMHASGEHLLTLIGDILDLSKIEAQKLSLALAPMSPMALFEQVVDITRPRALQKGLDLRLELGTPFPAWVRGDESRLRQVLLNLLANAIKFTPSGSVVLRASYGAGHGQTLVCEVTDTGIGIPHDQLDAIFEPFTQLTPDAQGREGVGLGLPISRSLVSLMGGTLSVSSVPGEGSTFRLAVALPETPAHRPSGTTDDRNISGYLGVRRHILVVDDNPVNAVLLQDILTPLGFDVRIASGGQEALQLAQATRPDLILLDLVMPQWDGVATLQALRADTQLSAVPVIGLSASNADGDRKQAFVDACNAFLKKPVQLGELLPTLQRLLHLTWQRTADDAPSTATTTATLQPAALAAQSTAWRAALTEAALSLDGEKMHGLIAQIASTNAALAAALSEMVDRFDYQAILDALEASRT